MKRYMLSILPLVLALCLMAGCGGRSAMHSRLAAVDSIVDSRYDSALTVLRGMDTLQMRRSDRMYLELLRAKAMNKASVPFTSDSVMRRVARYYDRHGSANQRLLAHYLLGCVYRDLGSAPRALEEYQRAASQADTTRADCDLPTLMRVHSQMAFYYSRMRLPIPERDELDYAMRLSYQMGDTLSALIFEEAKCNSLYNEQEYEVCIHKTKELYANYIKHGFKDNGALSCLLLIKSYMALEDYSEAKRYMDIYASCIYFKTDPRKVNGGVGRRYINEGLYYWSVGNADSSEIAFQKALPYHKLSNNALLIYKGLAQVYGAKHQTDSVLKYTKLYTDEKERQYNSEVGQSTLQMSALYNYGVEQQKVLEQAKRVSMWQGISCLLFVLFFVIGYNLWKKRQRTHYLVQELKQKIELIDELKSKDTRTSEELVQRDEQILKLTGQLEHLCHELNNKNTDAPQPELSKYLIVQQFRKAFFSNNISNIGKAEWDTLSDTISKRTPAFATLMAKSKKMNVNEYRVCLLVYCGFKSSQIDFLLGRKDSYAAKTRQRLHQKIFNSPGSPSDFDRKIRLLT